MKKILILSLVALSTLTANAQRKKQRANTTQGNWALRLGAGYNTSSVDPVDPTSEKSSEFNFSPQVGYFVSDNIEIGLRFDIDNMNSTNYTSASTRTENRMNTLGFGVYGQKYFPINNWFAFTGRLDLGLNNGNNRSTSYFTGGSSAADQGINTYGGAANFGFAFTPANNLAIQGDIIGLGGESGTIQNQAPVADVNISNFGFNVWRQPAMVHIVYYFGRGGVTE